MSCVAAEFNIFPDNANAKALVSDGQANPVTDLRPEVTQGYPRICRKGH